MKAKLTTPRRRWKKGLPPKDGQAYEARRRVHRPDGPWTCCLSWACWWNGRSFVEWNCICGGERWVYLFEGDGHFCEYRAPEPATAAAIARHLPHP